MGTFGQVKYLSFNHRLKAAIRRSCASVYYFSGKHRFVHKGKVLILMYHRVLKDDDEDISFVQPGMYVTESVFESQMKYLSTHYQMISMNDLLESWHGRRLGTDNRYCVVTFDDGWLDNYSNAYPILKKYRIPATIFLTTSFIGTNRWFWPDKAGYLLNNENHDFRNILLRVDSLKGVSRDIVRSMQSIIKGQSRQEKKNLIDSVIEILKSFPEETIEEILDSLYQSVNLSLPTKNCLLGWDNVKEMSNDLISFGSHTCNHKILSRVTLEEAKYELEKSMQTLIKKNVNYVPVIAYPNGNYNQEIINIIKGLGYRAAVTTKFGFVDKSFCDPYEINRIGIHNDNTLNIPLFLFHTSGLVQRFLNDNRVST